MSASAVSPGGSGTTRSGAADSPARAPATARMHGNEIHDPILTLLAPENLRVGPARAQPRRAEAQLWILSAARRAPKRSGPKARRRTWRAPGTRFSQVGAR